MSGKFKIEIDASKSEIEVFYEVIVNNEFNIPKDMFFIAEVLDEKGGVIKKTEEYNSFFKLASENLSGTIMPEKDNQKREIIVYWKWKDNEDVFLNDELSFSKCGFKLEIVGKQHF